MPGGTHRPSDSARAVKQNALAAYDAQPGTGGDVDTQPEFVAADGTGKPIRARTDRDPVPCQSRRNSRLCSTNSAWYWKIAP